MSLLFWNIPAGGYAWFHHPVGNDSLPVFEASQTEEAVSDTYIYSQNRAEGEAGLLGMSSSGSATMARAGTIKIDIPFNLLSKTVINPEALLDRQIAANLKVKNILEMYLAMRERNALLLKDLSIPYLENDPKKEKLRVPESIAPAREMKKKLTEVILFQETGRNGLPVLENSDFQAARAGVNQESMAGLSYEQKGEATPGEGDLSVKGGNRPSHTTYGRDTELPWIFAFGLKVIRYLVGNKVEVLAWATGLIMTGLIGVLVIKR